MPSFQDCRAFLTQIFFKLMDDLSYFQHSCKKQIFNENKNLNLLFHFHILKFKILQNQRTLVNIGQKCLARKRYGLKFK